MHNKRLDLFWGLGTTIVATKCEPFKKYHWMIHFEEHRVII